MGLVIFAGLTMSGFQRLRLSTDIDSAPLMAASIFLDALNVYVFQFFLQLFARSDRNGAGVRAVLGVAAAALAGDAAARSLREPARPGDMGSFMITPALASRTAPIAT